jgi:2-oxoglutarate dehydrogenase E2 component (dihydrolipoamide succinyltransferase)
MSLEIIAPSPGESITQVLLASWLVEDGSFVEKDTEIAEIESDKATLVVYAPLSGILHTRVAQGETVAVGAVIGTIDESQAGSVKTTPAKEKQKTVVEKNSNVDRGLHLTPLAKSMVEKDGIRDEMLKQLNKSKIRSTDLKQLHTTVEGRPLKRVKMSPLRIKLAERLVSVKNETAMLTTFNEIDMSRVISWRDAHKDAMTKKYGYTIGYISFFAKATAMAFSEFPHINASIDGEDIVYYEYADICIAVNTPKGLLAPAIRDVQKMGLIEIEGHIRDFSVRAKENKIQLDELRGGTFTISNGGTYGSLLSTPIINPPQSAILGMHKIEERPVAVNGKVEIHPMMYIALSYDHRLIDGKESVGFVMKVKEYLEHPELLFGGSELYS